MEHATSDLAIVVVNKLRYTEYVQPICIWGPVYDKTTLFGKRAVVNIHLSNLYNEMYAGYIATFFSINVN